MPAWLIALVSIASDIPQIVTLIEQIINQVKANPAVNVAAMQEHVAKFVPPAPAAPAKP